MFFEDSKPNIKVRTDSRRKENSIANVLCEYDAKINKML